MVIIAGWGDNGYGQLGKCSESSDAKDNAALLRSVRFPRRLSDNIDSVGSKITQIACGDDFSLFLSDSGHVFSCGQNNFGQLGLGPNYEKGTDNPVQVKGAIEGVTITGIYCGCAHCFAISDSGDLFSWGWNASGQCGFEASSPIVAPRAVPRFKNTCKKIVCGQEFTCILFDNGIVNLLGRVSFDVEEKEHTTFSRELTEEKYTDIACGAWHVLLVAPKCRVFALGHNDEGQLGIGSTDDSPKPSLVALPTKSVSSIKVACGRFHSFAWSDKGPAWAWGSGVFGQLGLSNFDPVTSSPQLLKGIPQCKKKLQIVSNLSDHSFFVVDNHDIYAFGCNDQGQLGLCDQNNRHSAQKIDSVVAKRMLWVCAGFRFSFFISESASFLPQTVSLPTMGVKLESSNRISSMSSMNAEEDDENDSDDEEFEPKTNDDVDVEEDETIAINDAEYPDELSFSSDEEKEKEKPVVTKADKKKSKKKDKAEEPKLALDDKKSANAYPDELSFSSDEEKEKEKEKPVVTKADKKKSKKKDKAEEPKQQDTKSKKKGKSSEAAKLARKERSKTFKPDKAKKSIPAKKRGSQ